MPYIIAAVLVIGFASGYSASSAMSEAEIIELEYSIRLMHREAEVTISALTKEADKAHEAALNANKQLEDAHVSTVNAINSQRDAFKSQRMYDNSRKSSSCTATKGGSTSSTAGADEDRHELSDKLTNFLKSEAYRADQIAAYAALCQKFVVVNNCGIFK